MALTLRDDILAVYKRACLEQELDIAEMLLHTIEAIARREGDDECLNHALLFFLDSMPTTRKLN